ncbi:MAG TPA: ABC transporter transmembrane domain-containing protein, partial [candidate division Zixibacteria bacterium]|nr:ABC transporter transmembrane domain-containing protein [candidate division Zixibacteria bacterium]
MNLYRRALAALKPYWKHLVTASVSAALSAVLAGLLVWMLGPLLMVLFEVSDPMATVAAPTATAEVRPATPGEATGNSGMIQKLSSRLGKVKESMQAWVDGIVRSDNRRQTLLNFCWLAFLVVIAKNVFLYLRGYFMAYVQQALVRRFRDQLFEKYQRLPLGYFHGRRTGQVISRITNDVLVLNDSVDIGFNNLVTDAITVIVLFAFLVILSWKLTLLSMIVMPLVFVFIWFVGKKLRKYSARTQERMADVNSVLEEAVTNLRIVKAFSTEEFETGRFFRATHQYFRSLLRMTRIRHLAAPINDKPGPRGRGDWTKWAIWIPWIGGIAGLAIAAGGYHSVQPLFGIETGATLTLPPEPGAPPWYMMYYIIVGLFLMLALVFG